MNQYLEYQQWGSEYQPRRLKYLAKVLNGATPSSSIKEYWNGNIKWATPVDVSNARGAVITDTERKITQEGYESCGTNLVPPDSIIMTSRAPVGNLAIAGDYLCTNQGCRSIVPFNCNHKFLFYFLHFPKGALDSISNGTTFKELSNETLRNLEIWLPPSTVQLAITNYLDAKTAQIDDLIAKKQKLIELLREERTGIINQAVTKGLDPIAKMKHSGVEWLGEIPAGWEVKRLKYIARVQGRLGFRGYTKADIVQSDGALTIGGKHINNDNRIDLTDPEFISWEKYNESPEIFVEKGHMLVAQRGTLGRVALIDKDYGKVTINPSLVILKNIMIKAPYLYWYLSSRHFSTFIEIANSATAVPMISQEQLENLSVVVPSVKEQDQIAEYLELHYARIRIAISRIEREIELLKEYRAALINDVVTGKIKVN